MDTCNAPKVPRRRRRRPRRRPSRFSELPTLVMAPTRGRGRV
jgi:hypothetical protein